MKGITHKTHRKKRSLFMLCIQSSNKMVPVFIDMVSVVTIKCRNIKGFDTEPNILKFLRAPMFSRMSIIMCDLLVDISY